MKSLTSLLTVSLMLATGTVLAHEPVKATAVPTATPKAMDHSKMDMPGMMSADHQKMAVEQFAKLDTNKDGSLSKVEFAKLPAMMRMPHGPMDGGKTGSKHGQMDHGKMGMSGMSPADQQKMATAHFGKLDSNNDGKLSKVEFAELHSMMGMQHGGMNHSAMEMPHDQKAHAQMDHEDDDFAKLDSNKDGKLSKSEIPAQHPMAAHFGMLDANKDGSLSKAEFAKRHGM